MNVPVREAERGLAPLRAIRIRNAGVLAPTSPTLRVRRSKELCCARITWRPFHLENPGR
jgi:hypothetical protein